jgi:hypothetical protein
MPPPPSCPPSPDFDPQEKSTQLTADSPEAGNVVTTPVLEDQCPAVPPANPRATPGHRPQSRPGSGPSGSRHWRTRALDAKGSRGPAQWLPPAASAHCAYAADWQRIADTYGLIFNDADTTAIQQILASC